MVFKTIQMEEEAFNNMGKTLKDAEEAINMVKLLNISLGLIASAIKEEKSLTLENDIIHIDSISVVDVTRGIIQKLGEKNE